MDFKKAERKRAKARVGISGPAGSGKTYSSILLAQGFTGKIALVDTEHGSGELYSHLTDYDVASLSPPFDPQRFIDIIKDAEAGGYATLIFDTLSHPWFAQGGLLEQHDMISRNPKENTYTAWREPTKKHYNLIEAIHQSNIHIISTFRAKQDYIITTDSKGRMIPQKVGLAPIQRDGIEYEYTIFFDLTVDHFATASKDRTSLFNAREPFFITPETGNEILHWLNSGAEPEKQEREPFELTSPTTIEIILERIAGISNIFEWQAWTKKHNHEIETLKIADKKKVYAALDKKKAEFEMKTEENASALVKSMLLDMSNKNEVVALKKMLRYMRKAGRGIEGVGSWDEINPEDYNAAKPYIEEEYNA